MSVFSNVVLATATTLILSLLSPYAVRPLLQRLGVMDVPNERSSHERPVLRGLGLATLGSLALGGALALGLTHGRLDGHEWTAFLTVVIVSIAAGVLGLLEDLRGLSVPVRSILLILIASAGAVGLLLTARAADSGPALVVGAELRLGAVGPVLITVLAVYGVLFVSSFINVANFMDGLNGISGFHGIIAGLTFAAAGWLSALPLLLAAGLLLAAAFAGFLPWNLSGRGAFLGDVGSYLLGGSIALTSFAAFVAGVPFLATIGPMVIYFGDVGVTLVKRVRAGRRWDEPHKEHVYQRIQQQGLTHVQASAVTAACTLVVSLLGLATLFTDLWGTLILLVVGLIVLSTYLRLPSLLPPRAA